jgi:hypothetical protein
MVLLMWVLFWLEKEEREPSDSFGNGKGIAIHKDGLNHTHDHSFDLMKNTNLDLLIILSTY